ncbi:hypothetical protein PIB30_108694, partial [Stylosanthes scabra]|nr:hypothetical protein [Stylosanthes scabra]
RKLADQETELGSKTERTLHAYACYIKSSPRLHNFKRDSDFAKLHSSMHMRGKHFGSKQLHKTHAYAWKTRSKSRLAQLKRDQDSSKPKSATHRRRIQRICVGSQ